MRSINRISHRRSIRSTILVTATAFVVVISLVLGHNPLRTEAQQKADAVTGPRLKPSASSVMRVSNLDQAKKVIRNQGLKDIKTTNLPNGETLISIETPISSLNVRSLESAMSNDPSFKILPNYSYRPALEANDPLYSNGSQWNLSKIEANRAWDITTGSQDATIAVIDSGVLSSQSWGGSPDCPADQPCNQPDFPADKIWTNQGEIGPTASEGPAPNCTSRGLPLDKSCNNIDDDNNGYTDDYKGWDFMGGWRGDSAVCPNFNSPASSEHPSYPGYIMHDNDPQPYSCDSPTYINELNRNHYNGTCQAFESACYTSHGTAVASVAAASSNNNELVAGVDWNARIMNVRALDAYGWSDSAHVTAAVEYATAMKADVINLSLAVFTNGSCLNTDNLLEDALSRAAAAGIVVVAAAGNGGTEGVCYPARSTHTIAVGATDSNDVRASFSSYGSELDVVAPGQSIPVSLAPNKNSNYAYSYLYANGTSFAAPHVAGLVGLIKSYAADATTQQIYRLIIEGTNKVSGMNGQNYTNQYGHGRINASRTLNNAISNGYAWEAENISAYSDQSRTRSFTNKITISPNEKTYFSIKARNTGNQTWSNSFLRVGTTDPRDRTSVFQDTPWLNPNRPVALTEDTVAPNSIGTFEFSLAAPTQTGSYRECFNLVAESRRWLTGSAVCSPINVVEEALPVSSRDTTLEAGEMLLPKEYILSTDGQSVFILQTDGNVVLYQNFRAIWSSRTSGLSDTRLVMQRDGNLVLYDNNGKALWNSSTHGNNDARVTLQNDGNFVMYTPNQTALWSTATTHNPSLLKYVNQILFSAKLYPGQQLETPDRLYRMVLQGDGNLVIYSKNTGALWSSKTAGKSVAYLAMQSDGNLVLYDPQSKPLWHTHTNGRHDSRLVMQSDGNLVVYDQQNRPIWHTGTYQK